MDLVVTADDVNQPEPPFRGTIQQRFLDYHRANPEIYRLIVFYARQAKRSGHRARYGMKVIFERVRWHVEIETLSLDDYKLNNDFSSRYARLVMEQEPDLADFFETRELKAD